MNKTLFAGIVASAVLGAAFAIPAEAACSDRGSCPFSSKAPTGDIFRKGPAKAKSSTRAGRAVHLPSVKRSHAVRVSGKSVKYASVRKAVKHSGARKTYAMKGHHPKSLPTSGRGGNVVALIKSMAPAQGVPTWFALRIAKVESNYNPHTRGAAGEYGVYQLKCATAKGIGYSGNCAGLLDARTNIRYGLKHLALAMRSSGGNLRLAASKHNGGLGRRTMVHGYVAKVF